MTNVSAKLRYLHITPRKVNLVARLIADMDALSAKIQLAHLPKRSALPLQKLLDSALANAQHNFHISASELFVKEIHVSQGPMLKRGFPRSRGRADTKRKRMSHITLVLQEKSQIPSAKSQKNHKFQAPNHKR